VNDIPAGESFTDATSNSKRCAHSAVVTEHTAHTTPRHAGTLIAFLEYRMIKSGQ
jgi:hypothetical protein